MEENKPIPYDIHTYSNGLRLITVPMPATESVTVLVFVGTGSRYETKEINGISHFLEHMMFKGTTKRPKALDIAHELDIIGASYNAFTSQEHTAYYAKAGTKHFDKILDIISDIFLNSLFEDEEIAKEKGVIVQEMKMYQDNPMRYVGDVLAERLYGDQPMGWQIIGKEDVVVNFKRSDFINYFNTHYFAGNTIVAVAGNVEPSAVREKVAAAFANARVAEKLHAQKIKEEQKEPAARIFQKQTDQTHFYLAFRTFISMFDELQYPLDVLNTVLGVGLSSRLWNEVREKRGLAYYINSSADLFLDSGFWAANAGVDNERVIPAIEVMLDEFRKVRDNGVTEKEFNNAKSQMNGGLAIGLETSSSLAFYYANELLRGEILTVKDRMRKIDEVSIEQVNKLAKEIFAPERLNLALIGPFQPDDEAILKSLKL